MAKKIVLLASAVQDARNAFEAAVQGANNAANYAVDTANSAASGAALAAAAANQAASDAYVNYQQVQDAINEVMTTSPEVNPDYISYDVGVLPDSTGAIAGQTIGLYYSNSGLLNKIRWDGSEWQEIGEGIPTRTSLGYINVKWFGARGDGVTDDTTAIQSAADSMHSGRAGLFFPPGKYRITSTISVDVAKVSGFFGHLSAYIYVDGENLTGIHYHGTTDGSANPARSVNQAMKLNGMGCTIRNINIYSDDFSNTGFQLDGIFGLIVEGSQFLSLGTGLEFVNYNRNIIISQSHFYECDIGIHFNRCNVHQHIISSCHFTTSRNEGSHAIFYEAGDVHNIHIVACDIEGHGPCSSLIYFHVDDTAVGNLSQIQITGNTIEAHSQNIDSLIKFVCEVEGSPRIAIVEIGDNEFSGSSEPAIRFVSDNNIVNVSIGNNNLRSINNYAIEISTFDPESTVGGVSNLVISGNSVSVSNPENFRMGFIKSSANSSLQYLMITGNNCSQLGLRPVVLHAISGPYEFVFTNNTISLAETGVDDIPGYAIDFVFNGQLRSGQIRGNLLRVRGYNENGMRLSTTSNYQVNISDNIVRGTGYGYTQYELPTPIEGQIVVRDNI